jgi:4-amino-4-deoxy-L-arabinose transferase-like glycosyltransferase
MEFRGLSIRRAPNARIAENLRNGVGYVGIATPGAQLNFPPLYPLLIAGTSFLTHNYEWAARAVAIILGALVPLPAFGIASQIFGRRVGLIAALLVSLHPLLVNLPCAVLSEAPYPTLLLLSVYVAIRALNIPSAKLWGLAGAAFGLTYLLRAEATGIFAIAVLFALAATEGAIIARCKRAAIAILAFLLLASPQVIFLYKSTGKLRLEVKSSIFF